MTCIVGLQHPTGVYIGGDSAVSSGWSIELTARHKVFRVGEFLIGTSGSPRINNLIQHAFAPPVPPKKQKKLEHFMVTEFVPALRAVLAEGGAEKKAHEEVSIGGPSCFLVGVRGRLFTVYSDYQVTYHQPGYSSVGCAHEVALGALHILTQMPDVSPTDIVLGALAAAETHNMGVRAPFVIEALPARA